MCEERTGKNVRRKSVFRWDRGLKGGGGGGGASETGGEAVGGEKERGRVRQGGA